MGRGNSKPRKPLPSVKPEDAVATANHQAMLRAEATGIKPADVLEHHHLYRTPDGQLMIAADVSKDPDEDPDADAWFLKRAGIPGYVAEAPGHVLLVVYGNGVFQFSPREDRGEALYDPIGWTIDQLIHLGVAQKELIW